MRQHFFLSFYDNAETKTIFCQRNKTRLLQKCKFSTKEIKMWENSKERKDVKGQNNVKFKEQRQKDGNGIIYLKKNNKFSSYITFYKLNS